jgi:hypothetical protein
MDVSASIDAGFLSSNAPLGDFPLEGLTPQHELVFVDEGVANYDALLAGLDANAEVFVLDGTQDGIAQIGDILSRYSGVNAVQIFSHGSAGSLQLGATTLTGENLAVYSSALQAWSSALSADADLLFFGCNLAATAEGQIFIEQLASLTGADVAASDDLTGNAALGGDWDLEVAFGQIEASIALNEASQNSYGYTLLVTPSIDTGSQVISFSGDLTNEQLSIKFNEEGYFAYSFNNTDYSTDLEGQTLLGTDFVSQSYSVDVDLGGGDDTFSLDASFTGLLDNGNATTTWTVTSADTGTIDAGSKTSVISFSNVENLVGGTSKDTFIIQNTSHLTSIEGGGDVDTVDLSASTVANTWTISDEDKGSVNDGTDTINYTAITDIVGSTTAQDTFVVETSGAISGTIDGGTSTGDVVTYATYDGPVGVNLGLNSATGIGEFTNIESFSGSTVDLTGSATLDAATPPTQVKTGDRIQVGDKFYDAVADIAPESGSDFDYDATEDAPLVIVLGDRVQAADGTIYQAIAVNNPGAGIVDLSAEDFSDAAKWHKITVDLSNDAQDYANSADWSEVTNTVIGGDAISTTWNITGTDAFSVDSLSFTAFGNILGGRGDDTFSFSDGASLSGVVNGGADGYYDFTFESKPDEPIVAGDRVVLEDGKIYEATTLINLPAGTGASYTTSQTPASVAIGDRVTIGAKIYTAVVAIAPESTATTVDLSEATQLYASNENWEPVTLDLSTQNYSDTSRWTPGQSWGGYPLYFQQSPL